MRQPESANRHLARKLLLACVALIAYGSLYPFDFTAAPGAGIDGLFALHRPTRGDLVANLLLYLPLGVCLAVAAASPSWVALVFVAIGLGAGISVVIEVLQLWLPARFTSGTDVLLNVVSTLAGAVAGQIMRFRLGAIAGTGTRAKREAVVPAGLVLLWLAGRTAPFVPTIDWQKYKNAVKPLIRWEDFTGLATLRLALGWAVVALALRLCWPRPRPLLALALLMAAVLAAQVVVVGRVLRPPEFVAMALVLAAMPLAAHVDRVTLARGLGAALATLIVVTGLAPFDFTTTPADFRWVPFAGSLTDSLEQNLLAMLEKLFLYGAVLWLCGEAGLRPRVAVGGLALALAGIEIAQCWLPGRVAESTDPLLALGLGALLHRLGSKAIV
jgi:VanZ family protein